ncbi:MAG: Crp/Fnr family transcriptional regulator [Desulfobacterales bacterium]
MNATERNFLENTDLFTGLPENALADAANCAKCRKLGGRQILFHQGDPAEHIFLLRAGRLKLVQYNESGDEVIIRYIGPNEFTAMVSVLENAVYPVTAEVIQSGEALFWDRNTMRRLMRDYPGIAVHALEMVLKQLGEIQERFKEVSTEIVEKRIARTLARFIRHSGIKTAEGILIDIPMSRKDLADFTGTTFYTVSRVMSSWERSQWIRTENRKILVLNPHALISFAEDFA